MPMLRYIIIKIKHRNYCDQPKVTPRSNVWEPLVTVVKQHANLCNRSRPTISLGHWCRSSEAEIQITKTNHHGPVGPARGAVTRKHYLTSSLSIWRF